MILLIISIVVAAIATVLSLSVMMLKQIKP